MALPIDTLALTHAERLRTLRRRPICAGDEPERLGTITALPPRPQARRAGDDLYSSWLPKCRPIYEDHAPHPENLAELPGSKWMLLSERPAADQKRWLRRSPPAEPRHRAGGD